MTCNTAPAVEANEPEVIAWDTHFTKGWTDENLWLDYMQARNENNFFEMDCIIRAQGAERPPVDARIYATHCRDKDLIQSYTLPPDRFASTKRDEEYDQLVRLAAMRDMSLEELPTDLPVGLRTLSYFAHHIKILPYTAGIDYMTTKDEYDWIQAGNRPTRPQLTDTTRRGLMTGRDLATYVHTDNPMKLWTAIVGELLSLGVPYKTPFDNTDTLCRADAPFVTGSMPLWWGLIGDVIGRTGPVNFREKHTYMAARPEEYAYKRYRRFLPMAFAEGSPMHGSHKAMHDIIARACAALVTELFDNHFELPNGNTVGYQVQLMALNVSDGRQWAGVHTQEDNRAGIKIAEVLGKRAANQYLKP